jgi:hypothetical protein
MRETRGIAVKETGIARTLRAKFRQSQLYFWANRHDMAAFSNVQAIIRPVVMMAPRGTADFISSRTSANPVAISRRTATNSQTADDDTAWSTNTTAIP